MELPGIVGGSGGGGGAGGIGDDGVGGGLGLSVSSEVGSPLYNSHVPNETKNRTPTNTANRPITRIP